MELTENFQIKIYNIQRPAVVGLSIYVLYIKHTALVWLLIGFRDISMSIIILVTRLYLVDRYVELARKVPDVNWKRRMDRICTQSHNF